jgi:hypothetical protein
MTRRPLRCLLIALSGTVAMAGVGCGLSLYWSRERVSSFYVIDAEFSDSSYLNRLDENPKKSELDREDFGFHAHRLKPGHGLVVAQRRFSPGTMAIDDESYEKLTIWLPADSVPSETEMLHSPGQAMVVLSSGGSAWPRNDCSGYVKGIIGMETLGDSIRIKVEGKLEPLGNSEVWDHCQPRTVMQQFEAKPMRFHDLTPWLGGAGRKHTYDETYPQ